MEMGAQGTPEDEAMHGRPCPLCKNLMSVEMADVQGLAKIAMCKSCGAKWKLSRASPPGPIALRPRLRWQAGRQKMLIAQLIEPGSTQEGNRLLGTARPLRFWSQMSGTGLTRPDSPQIIREVIKIRCKYCDNIYDMNLGKCPNCGAPS